MKNAVILGGSGQIGLGCARALAEAGWAIRLVARNPPPDGPWQAVIHDRTSGLPRDICDGADLLLDCIAFDAGHGAELREVAPSVGHVVAISSASVYRDAEGRTLDEAAETGFPHFPVPIPEDHPTVAPGPDTYSTRKIAMEQALLQAANATVLRPCAIHGAWSKHAREWWVVKRLLDGRPAIPICYDGASRFQTTSVAAIATTLLWLLQVPHARVLNVVDADAPTVSEIAQAIMAAMGRSAELVPFSGPSPSPPVGMTPWSTARPLVCASSAPTAGRYADTLPETLEWLLKTVDQTDWSAALSQLAAYPRAHFDYAAEDAWLQAR